MKKRITFILIISFLFNFCFYAQKYSMKQMLPAGHWIYDSLNILSLENSKITNAVDAPLSVEELYFYFNKIDYEVLSPAGKKLYDKCNNFFNADAKPVIDWTAVEIDGSIKLSPQLSGKINDKVEWSGASDYTGNTYYDFAAGERKTCVYGAGSSFLNSYLSKPLASLPLHINFSDIISFGTEYFYGKNFWSMSENLNFHNLAYKTTDMEFLWPRFAYGNVGYLFDNGFGINFNVGKEGMVIGRTATGSMIYNNTFETDAFVQLNLYTEKLKYDFDIIEVCTDEFMYLHNFEVNPWNWLRFGVVEGILVNGSFDFRFLNPLMVTHSFGMHRQLASEDEKKYYGEAHSCSYIGLNFDIVPVKNFRIYGLFSQVEMQTKFELSSIWGAAKPDSYEIQLGGEYNIPLKNGNWITTSIEGTYATPYHYLRPGKEWSLVRCREDMQNKAHKHMPIYSWIGTPFGPDSAVLNFKINYMNPLKWNVSFDYLFVAHGQNSFGIFNSKINIDGTDYYAYYPNSLIKMGLLTQEEGEKLGRTKGLSGNIQYTNQFSISGNYRFNDNWSINSNLIYSLIFNNNNNLGDIQNAFECSVCIEYKIF